MIFLVSDVPFIDWCNFIKKNNKCLVTDRKRIENYDKKDYKILSICIKNYINYNLLENNVFKNNIDNVFIFENKSKFCKFMLKNYDINIPITYYYNFGNETFINNINIHDKIIKKPNTSCGGAGITINNVIDYNLKDCIFQKYISHSQYYVGHFLVFNGLIHEKIYFSSINVNVNVNDYIITGNITNYTIHKKLTDDDSIFNKVFYDLQYSGFACSDFIIHNNIIIIFEINPRPGGSLIHNEYYFDLFIEKLSTII